MITKVGEVQALANYGGKSISYQFDGNWQHSPFEKFPDFVLSPSFEDLQPGYSFLGPDQLRWTFESIDKTGGVTFRSGAKKFYWKSGYQKAHSYSILSPKIRHDLQIVIPAKSNGSSDQKKLDWVLRSLKELPEIGSENLQLIRVNSQRNKWDAYWGEKYRSRWVPKFIGRNTFFSAGTGGGGVIDIYPAGLGKNMQDLFRHELGHLIAEGKYGTTMPDEVWRQAMRADGRAVSSYAKNSAAEDFAETVTYYLLKNAGVGEENWLFRPSYQKYASRFKILDEYFRVNPHEKRLLQDQLLKIRRVKVAGMSGVFIAGVGGGGTLFLSDDPKN